MTVLAGLGILVLFATLLLGLLYDIDSLCEELLLDELWTDEEPEIGVAA